MQQKRICKLLGPGYPHFCLLLQNFLLRRKRKVCAPTRAVFRSSCRCCLVPSLSAPPSWSSLRPSHVSFVRRAGC
jgi:hypothetical protein